MLIGEMSRFFSASSEPSWWNRSNAKPLLAAATAWTAGVRGARTCGGTSARAVPIAASMRHVTQTLRMRRSFAFMEGGFGSFEKESGTGTGFRLRHTRPTLLAVVTTREGRGKLRILEELAMRTISL